MNEIGEEVAKLFDVSRAIAMIEYVPKELVAVLSQDVLKIVLELVSSDPIFIPFI